MGISLTRVSASRFPSLAGHSLRLLFATVALACANAFAGEDLNRFARELLAGRSQTLVVYGTSLTAARQGWAAQLFAELTKRFGDRVKTVNAAKAGENSRWGLQNLDERVLAHHPNAVTIEFSMNDAAPKSHISIAQARANLEQLIDRIQAANSCTEIFLLTMNPLGAAVKGRPPTHPFFRGALGDYYQVVRDVARDRHVRLIDLHASWERFKAEQPQDFERHIPDGVHPDPEIARLVVLPCVLESLGFAK